MKSTGRSKLLMRFVLLLSMALFLLFWVSMGWSCLLRKATNIPCLACGMTRAWRSVFRLDFVAAFVHHPMFWSVPVLGLLWLFADYIPKRWVTWLSIVILLGYFVCYVIRMTVFFGSGVV